MSRPPINPGGDVDPSEGPETGGTLSRGMKVDPSEEGGGGISAPTSESSDLSATRAIDDGEDKKDKKDKDGEHGKGINPVQHSE